MLGQAKEINSQKIIKREVRGTVENGYCPVLCTC